MKGNGLLGIFIHNIKDRKGSTDLKGKNPFDKLIIKETDTPLSKLYPTYNWKKDNGYENLGKWVEKAARDAGR
ncbi:MAG: hypothetical protein R6U44_01555 [Archaeoglobaceae archaeon]